MKIEIHLYASLMKYMSESIGNDDIVEVDQGLSVKELLKQVKVPMDLVKIVFVNGVHAAADTILKDSDRVGVFPPVGGG